MNPLYHISFMVCQRAHDKLFCFILVWISGDEAIHMESLTDVQVKEGMMSLLKDFLQREIPEPIRVIRWENAAVFELFCYQILGCYQTFDVVLKSSLPY